MELWLHRSRPHRSDRENLVRSHAHPILGFADPRSVSWRQASNQFVSQPRPATEPDRSCLATHDESYVPRPREIWPAAPDRGSAQVGLPAPCRPVLINRQFFGPSADFVLQSWTKKQPNDIKRNVPLAFEPLR